MTEVIQLLFSEKFLLRALIVGVLISLCAALLGVSLVLKRFSMIGDGLSHVGFGALAIATALNVAPLYFSLPIVIVAAFLLLRMSESGKIKGDAAIALISTGALAIGVMVTSMTSGMNVDIYNYMFGSILTMSGSDVYLSLILSVAIIILFVAFYNEIFAVTFDESFAKATGTKANIYNMLIAGLTAVTIVIGMRMMGALLISSLIIFPTITSMRICKSFKKVVLTSSIVSVVCFLIGLVLSVRFEAPTGASVVCVNILMLAVFSVIRAINQVSPQNKIYPFKRVVTAVFCVIVSALVVLSCFIGEFSVYKKEKITVVTTGFAPYDFARQISGDDADVIMLLSPGEESHTFEPTPNDILKIKECDVFVYGGGESDEWVNNILDSLDTSKIKIVRMMDTVELFEEATVEGMENEEETEEASDDEAEYDEHVWTSPKNAIKIVNSIADSLCLADSDNSSAYRSRQAEYIKKLSTLDENFSELISNRTVPYIVVGDRFPFRYFVEEYNLSYYAAFPGCSAQAEANPTTIAFLNEKIRNENIPVVFKVDMSKGSVAKSISESTGAKVLTLYSCHVISADDYNNGETYISLMERNLSVLRDTLY